MKGMIWISDQWQRKPWRSRWNYLVKMSGEIDGEMGWEKRRESRVSAGRLGRVCDGRRRWRKSVDSPTIVVPSIPLPPCLLSGEESGRRNSYRNNILESTLGNPSSPPPLPSNWGIEHRRVLWNSHEEDLSRNSTIHVTWQRRGGWKRDLREGQKERKKK